MSEMKWFRFYPEVLSDIKFARIARETGISKITIIGAWTALLCAASNSPIRGSLYVTFQKRFSNDDVTELFCFDNVTTKKILDAFLEMDMLSIENDAFVIKNWKKRQYESDNSTERVQKYRMKRDRNVSETPSDTDTDTDTDTELIKREDSGAEISAMQKLVEQLTGMPTVPTPDDIAALAEFERVGVDESDIRAALMFFRENGNVARGPANLRKSVLYQHTKRVQADNARASPPQSPGKNGSSPLSKLKQEYKNNGRAGRDNTT